MRWYDVDLDTGKWTIPKEPGDAKQKGAPDELVLPPVALDLIRAQVRLASSPWIFPAYRGDGHLSGVGELKKAFDAKLPPTAAIGRFTICAARHGRTWPRQMCHSTSPRKFSAMRWPASVAFTIDRSWRCR